MNHLFRIVLSILLAAVVASCGSQSSSEIPTGDVDIGAARDLIAQEKDVIVLDVRTPAEFALGHIEGALNINIAGADFTEKVSKLDRDKSYIVHCAANTENGRAARSVDIMSGLGFNNLLSMEGGFMAWEKADHPVVKIAP